ncbi:7248_t:CDS:10 [Acaulospora morrowiae]|uniref:7248_t:CDS:1 n=1 Tax=Acaulospora morrowiae TaxID=94023 RepID=A0A9N9FQ87_9GLOM|nr:7248_t:CDS:10 [Acaulospora morrowiae]
MSGGLISEPLCPRSIFWSNLVLLDFDPSELAVGAYSTIDFDKDVFAKGYSNSVKAMELIVYFLFRKLDEAQAKEKFTCWPCLDLTSSKIFRNVAYTWLENLKKEGFLGNKDIILRRSAFDECQGDRFERVIMVFSNYVLKVVLERDYQQYSGESAPELLRTILKIHIKMQADKFLKETKERVACQDRWRFMAEELSRRLLDVTKRNNDLESQIYDFRKSKNPSEMIINNSIEKLSSMRIQHLEGVRLIWNSCLGWIQENKKYIDIVEDVMNDRANKRLLDGQSISIHVPDIMMTMWEKQIQKAQIVPFSNGRLNLISLLKLWRFTLKTLNKQLINPIFSHRTQESRFGTNSKDWTIKDELPSTCKKLEECFVGQKEQLRSLSSLKNSLCLRLSEINGSIRMLRDERRTIPTTFSNNLPERQARVTFKVPSFCFDETILMDQSDDIKSLIELKLRYVKEDDGPSTPSPVRSKDTDLDNERMTYIIRTPLYVSEEQAFMPMKEIKRTPQGSSPSPGRSALKSKAVARTSIGRAVRFAEEIEKTPTKMMDVTPIMDETPPRLISEVEY